ncbi:hypothetical protein [Caldivirga sp.]|uniref:hypothetical protein n=1 Tax=Caldivirga sp. TaxID=2080243 RepID=UPI0025BF0AE8|nr:hypothetical protein [Caldivirga sp.]
MPNPKPLHTIRPRALIPYDAKYDRSRAKTLHQSEEEETIIILNNINNTHSESEIFILFASVELYYA